MGTIRRIRRNIKPPKPTALLVVQLDWALNGCPLFVGIPKRDSIQVNTILDGVRKALGETIKRSQMPNMRDIYEAHILQLEKLKAG